MAATGLLAASVAILVGTVALFVWRARNPVWVRDAQLTQNASPVTSVLLLVLGVLVAALVLAFGIVLIRTGHSLVGWAMVCLAAARLVHASVAVWIRRRPLS